MQIGQSTLHNYVPLNQRIGRSFRGLIQLFIGSMKILHSHTLTQMLISSKILSDLINIIIEISKNISMEGERKNNSLVNPIGRIMKKMRCM